MTPLSQITRPHALQLLRKHLNMGTGTSWTLSDRSKEFDEPCKKLESYRYERIFWFFDDGVTFDNWDKDEERAASELNQGQDFHMPIEFLLGAHDLGYYVPALSDRLNQSKS